jgi:hypothetical protein
LKSTIKLSLNLSNQELYFMFFRYDRFDF